MNLNTIKIAPFAQGLIKIDSEVADGELKTLNQFAILARHHDQEGEAAESKPTLVKHPIEQELREKIKANAEAERIVAIPVRMFFNKTENSIGIKYQAYDINGRPVCAGDGKSAQRLTLSGDGTQTIEEVSCPGCETCPYANGADVKCARQVRMTVQIDGQSDALSTFEVRSSSLNTYRTLKAQLSMIEKRFHGLRHVPLRLTLWQASNQASNYQPFDAMRLEIDALTEAQAYIEAKRERQALSDTGLDDDMDAVFSAQGLAHESSDEFSIVRDFYEDKPVRRASPAAVHPFQKPLSPQQSSALDYISRVVQVADTQSKALHE